MTTVMSYSGHGHAPYIMAEGIGREIGDAVVTGFPQIADVERKVLRKFGTLDGIEYVARKIKEG